MRFSNEEIELLKGLPEYEDLLDERTLLHDEMFACFYRAGNYRQTYPSFEANVPGILNYENRKLINPSNYYALKGLMSSRGLTYEDDASRVTVFPGYTPI